MQVDDYQKTRLAKIIELKKEINIMKISLDKSQQANKVISKMINTSMIFLVM
jgi:hypothetical protein